MRASPLQPGHELIEEREELEEGSREKFDRMAFAMSAIELVRPPGMTVAVCQGSSRLRVEEGRSWGRGKGARWALVSIPPNASRRAIAVAVTQLAAGKESAAAPYAIDVLFADSRGSAGFPGLGPVRAESPRRLGCFCTSTRSASDSAAGATAVSRPCVTGRHLYATPVIAEVVGPFEPPSMGGSNRQGAMQMPHAARVDRSERPTGTQRCPAARTFRSRRRR
jgi:hypothetical protein